MAKSKDRIHLVAILTDKPEAWKMTVEKPAKSLQFMVSVDDEGLTKQDIKFINANLKRFAEVRQSLKGGEVTTQQ